MKHILEYWELVFILSKRDVSVRYKQTVLGFIWALVKPLLTMVIFLFFYKKAVKVQDISGYPIQLILFSGLIFWFYFTNSLQAVSNSILVNSNLVGKVYFPRIILCISALSVPLVDFGIGLGFYSMLSIYLGYGIGFNVFTMLISLILCTILSMGLGMIFASMTIKYRDLQHLLPLIIQYGLFITPILYTAKSLKEQLVFFDWYTYFNPLIGLVELFRFAVLPNYLLYESQNVVHAFPMILGLFTLGLSLFLYKQDSFVDYL